MSAVRAAQVRPAPAAVHADVARATLEHEIAALRHLQARLGPEFEAAVEELLALRGALHTVGVGKSGHAAQKVAATLRSVGIQAQYLNASDSLHGDLGIVGARDAAILFSKSGTTHELLMLVPHLVARNVRLIAVTGNPASPLAEACDIALDASVEREGCPLDAAPMASVLTAIAIGDALAAAVIKARDFTPEDFARLHPAGALGARMTLKVRDVMRRGDSMAAVDVDSTLREAVIEITRTRAGAVCVVDGTGRLAGLVTDGDVRRQLVESDHLAAIPVAEIMNPAPLTVSPGLSLSRALFLMEQGPGRGAITAPVVDDDGRCVGLLRLHETVQAHLPS